MGGINGIFNFTSAKKRSKSYTSRKHLDMEITFIPKMEKVSGIKYDEDKLKGIIENNDLL